MRYSPLWLQPRFTSPLPHSPPRMICLGKLAAPNSAMAGCWLTEKDSFVSKKTIPKVCMPKNAGAKTEEAAPKAALSEGREGGGE